MHHKLDIIECPDLSLSSLYRYEKIIFLLSVDKSMRFYAENNYAENETDISTKDGLLVFFSKNGLNTSLKYI